MTAGDTKPEAEAEAIQIDLLRKAPKSGGRGNPRARARLQGVRPVIPEPLRVTLAVAKMLDRMGILRIADQSLGGCRARCTPSGNAEAPIPC